MLGDERQQFGRRDGAGDGSLEAGNVPGDEVVRLRLFGTRSLHSVLKVWPMQGQGVAHAILIDGLDQQNMEEVLQGSPSPSLGEVLAQEVVQSGYRVRGEHTFDDSGLDELENELGSEATGSRSVSTSRMTFPSMRTRVTRTSQPG